MHEMVISSLCFLPSSLFLPWILQYVFLFFHYNLFIFFLDVNSIPSSLNLFENREPVWFFAWWNANSMLYCFLTRQEVYREKMKIKYIVHIWRRSTQGSNKKNTVIHNAIDFESPIIVIIVIVDFLGGLVFF
jgi:hypothetical protein